MTLVLLKLPSGLVFSCIYTLYPFLGAPQGISSRLFSNFSISGVSQLPMMGFTEEKAQQLKSLVLYDSQSYWWPYASPHLYAHLTLIPLGISYWPSGDKCTFCSREDKASLRGSNCGALARAELLPAGEDLKILWQTGTLWGGNSTW